jgi:hypothetical protein
MVNLFAEILTMGEEKAEATGGEASSLIAEPAVSDPSVAQNEPATASGPEAPHGTADIVSPALAPEQDSPAEMSDAAAPRHEPKNKTKNEPELDRQGPEAGAGACDEAKAEATPMPGKVIVVPFGDRAWNDNPASERDAGERQEISGRRRFAAMAAMVVLATGAGAFGGALATATFFHGTEAAGSSPALEASVARIDADILALKASLEYGSKLGQSQFNKTSDRLDKIERAQAEPAARLARLGEAVDKLRAAPVPLPAPIASAPAAAREITGSVSPASSQATSKTETSKNETSKTESSKTEVGRLPTLEGWVLRDVVRGGALIDGRRGMYEVYAGDIIPGLGRIDAIRRQDGRWVVVTSKGLIVAH